MQTAFIESFNGRFRDELLNETQFPTLEMARQEICAWRHDYNHQRPHSGHGNIPPAEFVARKGMEMRAAQPQTSTRESSDKPEDKRVSGQYGSLTPANCGAALRSTHSF